MKRSTKTWLFVGGGALVLGAGVYFLTKKPAAAATSTTAALASPGGTKVVYTDANGVQYTRDHAAQVACQLRAIGHPTEAVFWANLVTSNGGALPC